jgi:hypothetical protein
MNSGLKVDWSISTAEFIVEHIARSHREECT